MLRHTLQFADHRVDRSGLACAWYTGDVCNTMIFHQVDGEMRTRTNAPSTSLLQKLLHCSQNAAIFLISAWQGIRPCSHVKDVHSAKPRVFRQARKLEMLLVRISWECQGKRFRILSRFPFLCTGTEGGFGVRRWGGKGALGTTRSRSCGCRFARSRHLHFSLSLPWRFWWFSLGIRGEG